MLNNLPPGVTQAMIDSHYGEEPNIFYDIEILSKETHSDNQLEIELNYFTTDKKAMDFLEEQGDTVKGWLNLPDAVIIPLDEFKDSTDEEILYYIETEKL